MQSVDCGTHVGRNNTGRLTSVAPETLTNTFKSGYKSPTVSGPQSGEETHWLLSVMLVGDFGQKDARRAQRVNIPPALFVAYFGIQCM